MDSAVQLYTLRNVDEPVATLVTRVGETTLDGVEFAAPPSENGIAEALTETGLAPVAAHVADEQIERDVDRVVEALNGVGCATVVVPYLDESYFNERDAVTEAADRLEELAEMLDPHGIRLCYHNHDHEFISPRDTEGRSAFELLVEETDPDLVSFELDLGWAQAGGYDPTELLQRYGDRIPLVHLKDVDRDGTPVELCDGELDVPACVEAARDADVEWIIYEHDDPEDPVASLADGATVLEDPRRAR
jgi:sugar phosphate isomerase/epimerase